MRSVQFIPGSFYHIFNRGVDKRQIFMDDHDFLRFYVSLYAFNDEHYSGRLSGLKVNDVVQSFRHGVSDTRKRLVDIHSFILRGNHFHMLIRANSESGIPYFLRCITQGYARYFNLRHKRSGALFEGSFKAVAVQRDSQLMHLPRYIHLNALDGKFPEWRDGKIADWDLAVKTLDNYRWSSHGFFNGKSQLLPVVQEIGELGGVYDSPKAYIEFLHAWAGGKYRF